MNVCAKCGFENDDNSKNCANCLTDIHWAKVNLGKFHGNKEDTRRIGVESRKEHGYSVPEDESTPLEPIQIVKNEKMTSSPKSNFAIGCIGWFLFGNLTFFILYSVPFVFPFITVLITVLLFASKKNWYAYGVIAAVITNTLFMVILGSIIFPPLSLDNIYYYLLFGVTFPLPIGILAFQQ